MTREPLVNEAAAFSPSEPHAVTLKNEVCSTHSLFAGSGG